MIRRIRSFGEGFTLKATLLVMVAGAFIATPARADLFSLTDDHCTGGCLPPSPGGTITVTQNGTNDVLVVVNLDPLLKFVNTGLDDTFDFNISGEPTISISFNTSGFALNGTGAAGDHHMDGLGHFDYSLDCTGCGSGGSGPLAGPLSFDVIATGLVVADFNSTGAHGSLDAFGADLINTSTGNTGAVGSSGGGTISSVPEPLSSALVGTGLISLFFLRRRASW